MGNYLIPVKSGDGGRQRKEAFFRDDEIKLLLKQ